MMHGLFEVIGSLGLFLYGMKIMSDGIQKVAGERLHKVVNYMTWNRFTAVLTGFFITTIIQSSSATTVMVVSFVNAGLLKLVQAIGVIMGANIGTTVTGWIVAVLGFKFKISTIALPAIGIGFPLLILRKYGKQNWGETLIGFGLLFLGLNFLKHAVPDIKSNPEILAFLSEYTNMGILSTLLFIGVGTVLTVVVQSSSAAMAVTLTMAYAGWIDFHTAAAIVLGENIGTTVTAYLASIGTQVNAKRAARAHTIFNLIGVVWILFVFNRFIGFIDHIVPGEMGSKEAITTHLAMFHTMFNIINTCLLLAFVPALEKLVRKLCKPAEDEETLERYELKYLSTSIQDTAEINILNAKMELVKMSEILGKMFSSVKKTIEDPKRDIPREVEKLQKMEDYTDQMEEQISQFLIECTSEELNDVSAKNANLMIRITNEMESIADCCYTLILLCQRRVNKKIQLNPEAIEKMKPYTDLVTQFLDFIKSHLNEHLSRDELEKAYAIEKEVDEYRKNLKKEAQDRLQERNSDVKGELLYIDILQHVENIGDYCLNISQALRQFY